MTTSTQTNPLIAEFAAAVRDALADLPRDEVDELTDGLEADLTDRSLEPDAPALGDATAYADELRFAAGLPPRGSLPRRTRVPLFEQAIANARENLRAVSEHPRGIAVREFLVALRPAWWLLRGWLVYFLLSTLSVGPRLLPENLLLAVVLVAAVVTSVQVGRGRWLSRPGFQVPIVIVNVIVLIGAPFALGWTYAAQSSATSIPPSYADMQPVMEGLMHDGAPVSNIFAYGPDGQPIEGVQLFDQDGEPLDLAPYEGADYVVDGTGNTMLVPSSAAPGQSGWNVVPLEKLPVSALEPDGTVSSSATPRAVGFPYREVQPLAGFDADDTTDKHTEDNARETPTE